MAEAADSLADIRALNTRPGSRCETGVFLRLHPALADTVIEAMADDTIQGKAISRWLANKGITLSFWSINRHRRGDCGCE